MNKINIHMPPKFSRLMTVILFLLSSNILYSQYYSCTSANPCPDLSGLGNYTLSGHKWDKSVLKYYFINGTDDISGDGEKTAFYTAFNTWSAVVPIRFEETLTLSEADIKIRFATTSEWSSATYSLSPRELSYYPEQNCKGNIILNDDYWDFNLTAGSSADLVYIAIHEVGHVLGLCHSDNPNTMMYINYSPKRSLHSYDIQGIQLIYPSIPIKAQNNFNGGSIYVNNFSIAKTAPYNFEIETGDEVEISLGAIEQNDGTYDRIWNDTEAPLNLSTWVKETSLGGRSDKSFSQNYTFDAKQDDNNSTYEAGLRKVFNIDFQNQLNGTSFKGQIKVDGEWKDSPTTKAVVEQNLISVDLNTHYEDGYIRFIFEKWNDNVTSTSRSLYPNSHTSYTAIYKGYPIFSDDSWEGNLRNLSISGTGGSNNYVKLTWSDHPNDYVTQYHIYRYYKHNGVVSSPVHLATRNRGTLSFTDVEYTYNPGSGDFILWYDVRAYYSPDGTTSPIAYVSTKGDQSGVLSKLGSGEEITYYDITNYPNPYNPQTTIRFQLPQEGFVTIKVFDAIGKEVTTLLNEEKDGGIYELKFNGIDLPSGMYIYTIKVNDYFASKKMLLIK